VLLAGTVIETWANEIQFTKQGSVNDGVLPFPVPLCTTMRADFELCEIFFDLFGDHGLLHAV